jgi:8-oxo-dGTP pyrophosphatase MutT (NUDIX family)
MLNRLREAFLAPLISRPRLLQIAALCIRRRGDRSEVLLVTSRTSKRWILPKGWPHRGVEEPGSALAEAWEEAGVKRADVSPSPIGRYRSMKRSKSGLERPCDVLVFRVDVRQMADDFPERGERRRIWVSPAEAVDRVDEPGLKALLRDFATTSPSE